MNWCEREVTNPRCLSAFGESVQCGAGGGLTVANTSGYLWSNNAFMIIMQATGHLSIVVNWIVKVNICHKH